MIQAPAGFAIALGGLSVRMPRLSGPQATSLLVRCLALLVALSSFATAAIGGPGGGATEGPCGSQGTVEGRPVSEWCGDLRSSETQLRALEVLQVFGADASSCRAQVERLLKSEDEEVRQAALLTLNVTISEDREMQAILSKATKDGSPLVRSAAAQIAGKRFAGSSAWSEWVAGLIESGLADDTVEVQAAWLGVISRVGERGSISKFTAKAVKLYERDDAFLKNFCLRAIGACARVDDVRAKDLLLRALESGNREERCAASLALMRSRLGVSAGSAVVLSLLAEEDPKVRSCTIMNLNGAGVAAPEHIKAIGALIVGDRDAGVRRASVNYFVHQSEGREAWRASLESALGDRDERVSELAALALIRGGVPPPSLALKNALLAAESRPAVLLRALRARVAGVVDPTDANAFESASIAAGSTREGAARAIGFLPVRPPWAEVILVRLMCHDSDAAVRKAAREVVEHR